MSSLVAAASSSGGSASFLIFALPVLLIGFMFVTQRRRTKETQRLQSTLGVGDEVTTTSGMLGRITALDDQIDLTGFGTDYMANVHAHMATVGKDVVIDFGGGDMLTILKTTIATLDAHSFDFHLV